MILYRHFDARGQLLYVGLTGCLRARFSQQRCAHWWRQKHRTTVERLPSRRAALWAEACAIALERPRFNRHGSGSRVRRSITLPADLMDYLSALAARDFHGNLSLAITRLILNKCPKLVP